MHEPRAPGLPRAATSQTRGRYTRYTLARLQALSARLAALVRPDVAPLAIALAGPTGRIAAHDATRLDFRPAGLDSVLGPQWVTWWARLAGRVPAEWQGSPVELRWASRCEALLRIDGEPVAGLNPGREYVRIVGAAAGSERLDLLLEIACNATFGTFEEWTPFAPPPDYRIDACELVRVDADAWALYHDFETLRALLADADPPQVTRASGSAQPVVRRPGLDSTWAGRLLHRLNAVANALDPDDRATWPAARATLADLLATQNGGCVHEVSAIGHAHIDTAWLWPIDETRRKCTRSFATVVDLMERYPTFRFAASQAWQYDQIERHEPALFRRIQAKAKSGQWLPVGGTWVEPDCNLPSGESLCRQFLYGQRWFASRFGARCRVFWNPDVFGYDGQLPQIMREAGIDRFLTQKLSWNRFTSPPHHSFRWRGIDGSEVLTHFPPADTYNGRATIEEFRYQAANYKDADRSIDGLYLFGFGDGGGGPTAEMVERLERSRDLLGVPRVTMRGPDSFFDLLEQRSDDLQTVAGELYFEFHRGTYTTEGETKRLNRRCQDALQDLDLACVLAKDRAPPRPVVENLWRAMLTQQFHDILPGTSIAEVHERSRTTLSDVAAEASRLVDDILDSAAPDAVPFNTLGMARAAVLAQSDGALGYAVAQPFSPAQWTDAGDCVLWRRLDDGGVTIENAHLAAVLTATGELSSLFDKTARREALAGAGNRIVLYDDRPTDWDAWDIDPFALETGRDAPPGKIADAGGEPMRAWVRVERRLGAGSYMNQTITLDAGARMLVFATEIEWQERHVLVKAQFPLTPRSDRATYETMFGAAARPTHANTDADAAQFEVPAHRWADLGDGAFGVALLSDARHGFSCRNSDLALSLVRGPAWPNPDADRGTHRFRYALMPHAGAWQDAGVVREAAAFARPWRWIGESVTVTLPDLAKADAANVVIDTVKPSEDGGDVVMRLYESCGRSVDCRLTLGFDIGTAWRSNILEDKLEEIRCEERAICLSLRPYQLVTLRVRQA